MPHQISGNEILGVMQHFQNGGNFESADAIPSFKNAVKFISSSRLSTAIAALQNKPDRYNSEKCNQLIQKMSLQLHKLTHYIKLFQNTKFTKLPDSAEKFRDLISNISLNLADIAETDDKLELNTGGSNITFTYQIGIGLTNTKAPHNNSRSDPLGR